MCDQALRECFPREHNAVEHTTLGLCLALYSASVRFYRFDPGGARYNSTKRVALRRDVLNDIKAHLGEQNVDWRTRLSLTLPSRFSRAGYTARRKLLLLTRAHYRVLAQGLPARLQRRRPLSHDELRGLTSNSW